MHYSTFFFVDPEAGKSCQVWVRVLHLHVYIDNWFEYYCSVCQFLQQQCTRAAKTFCPVRYIHSDPLPGRNVSNRKRLLRCIGRRRMGWRLAQPPSKHLALIKWTASEEATASTWERILWTGASFTTRCMVRQYPRCALEFTTRLWRTIVVHPCCSAVGAGFRLARRCVHGHHGQKPCSILRAETHIVDLTKLRQTQQCSQPLASKNALERDAAQHTAKD